MRDIRNVLEAASDNLNEAIGALETARDQIAIALGNAIAANAEAGYTEPLTQAIQDTDKLINDLLDWTDGKTTP